MFGIGKNIKRAWNQLSNSYAKSFRKHLGLPTYYRTGQLRFLDPHIRIPENLIPLVAARRAYAQELRAAANLPPEVEVPMPPRAHPPRNRPPRQRIAAAPDGAPLPIPQPEHLFDIPRLPLARNDVPVQGINPAFVHIPARPRRLRVNRRNPPNEVNPPARGPRNPRGRDIGRGRGRGRGNPVVQNPAPAPLVHVNGIELDVPHIQGPLVPPFIFPQENVIFEVLDEHGQVIPAGIVPNGVGLNIPDIEENLQDIHFADDAGQILIQDDQGNFYVLMELED